MHSILTLLFSFAFVTCFYGFSVLEHIKSHSVYCTVFIAYIDISFRNILNPSLTEGHFSCFQVSFCYDRLCHLYICLL